MVDTSLNSLAQNLDMADWPLKGATETPAKYIDHTFAELCAMPGIAGRRDRVDQLVTILKETLAFDQPFGEMIGEGKEESEKDNPIIKNLAKLGIPENFPMSLVALTAETREFCTLENLKTLKEFSMFAQNMAQSVIVGGDFRALLNALSHIDEATLAMYLPFRPGSRGLHLIEGIALAVRAFSPEIRAAMARSFGARLGSEDANAAARASRLETEAAVKVLTDHTASYAEHFQSDLAAMQKEVDQGVALGRLASVLKDPVVESIVTSLLKPYLSFPTQKVSVRATTPPVEAEAPSRGFFATLLRWFKK
ncbi:hypothetical protein DB347_10240 [Opitutaceae bacterium EW11]|nr:hypothetical protein DB347_10240 [Opitutaceae bacterium EW11]